MNPLTYESAPNRPNFFPGQRIDYRNFNQLATQPHKITAFLSRKLFPNGGILGSSSGAFEITLLGSLKVCISGGSAILPDGQLLNLKSELLLDLAPYVSSDTRTLIVGLANKNFGYDSYQDPQDPSVQGFLSETVEPQITVSVNQLTEQSVEIFRVRLSQSDTELEILRQNEIWNTIDEKAKSSSIPSAKINLLHRKVITSSNFSPLGIEQELIFRKLLFKTDSVTSNIHHIFDVNGHHAIHMNSGLLHGAILEFPLQTKKVNYLIGRFADSLAIYIEALADRIPEFRKDLSHPELKTLLHQLEPLREQPALNDRISLEPLMTVLSAYCKMGSEISTQIDKVKTIEQSIADKADRYLDFSPNEIFAGYCFDKVCIRDALSKEVEISAQEVFPRLHSAQYRDGSHAQSLGKFISKGRFNLSFDIKSSRYDTILFLRHFERRQVGSVRYLLNGKLIERKNLRNNTAQNRWRNLGWYIPADHLLPSNNQLSIFVEESELEFGFFELFAYQNTHHFDLGVTDEK